MLRRWSLCRLKIIIVSLPLTKPVTMMSNGGHSLEMLCYRDGSSAASLLISSIGFWSILQVTFNSYLNLCFDSTMKMWPFKMHLSVHQY